MSLVLDVERKTEKNRPMSSNMHRHSTAGIPRKTAKQSAKKHDQLNKSCCGLSAKQDCQLSNGSNSDRYNVDSFQTMALDTSDWQKEKKSDEEVAHYLLNELLVVVQNMPRLNRERISFLDYMEILREMNMIPSSYEPVNDDEVYDMWAMLCQGGRELSACLVNLGILLLAVMDIKGQPAAVKKFFEIVPILQSRNTLQSVKKRLSHVVVEHPFNRSKEGHFNLSKTEVRKIYRTFKSFRLMRIHLGQIDRKTEMSENKSTNYPFQPQISTRSKQIAKKQSSREKSQQKRTLTSRQKKNLQQCTFQPNIQLKPQIQKTAGIKKSEELYLMGKRKKQEKELFEARNSEDMPSTVKSNPRKPKPLSENTPPQPIKAWQKEINRMKKGRLEKQLKEAFKGKGNTTNDKIYRNLRKQIEKSMKLNKPTEKKHFLNVQNIDPPVKMQHDRSKHQSSPIKQSESPKKAPFSDRKVLMTIEVYISEGQVHNLIIRQGDQPEILAREFGRQYNLDGKMVSQLTKEIDSAVKFTLCQIEQQSIQYSEDS